ncbi:MAG: ComF family protein [Sphingobium sp.]|nr:ComF family protein [Sphingobium sp.]MBP6110850.1 ComF family protein [Sphingobium sp.]MBP8670006.1 ComF family protein [Sphingobium sp.]MBP9157129.1 ComF family protein [Sphingobium sp.]MCC6481078.1 ComF family protein [Sphingomonadaceae bacterium]
MAQGKLDLLRYGVRAVVDYALPPRCPGCGEIMPEAGGFCGACWAEMRFLGDPCCTCCGLPLEVEEEEEARQCGACLAEPPPWASARAALAYGPVSSHIAMRLKYGRRTGLARLMAQHMVTRLTPAVLAAQEMAVIIPVPLHRWRLWGRGFNQSALLARHIARITGLAHDPLLLKRSRRTRPLRDLGPREREREVRRAFMLDIAGAKSLNGKAVVLVDDIHTSGATARACIQTLLASGAREVHLLCWARVL